MDLAVMHIKSRVVSFYPLPEGFSANTFQWSGDRIHLSGERPLNEPREDGRKIEVRHWLLDTRLALPQALVALDTTACHLSHEPFIGGPDNQPKLFLPDIDSGQTHVIELETLKRAKPLPYEAIGIGHGWWMRIVSREDKKTQEIVVPEIVAVEVYDTAGRRAVRIDRSALSQGTFDARPRFPLCACISPDGSRLLIAFETDTIFRRHSHEYTFGVYSVKTGRLEWKGSSNALRGWPAFLGDSVYLLEAKERTIYTGERTAGALLEPSEPTSEPVSAIVLSKHTSTGRQVIRDVQLKEGEKATRYMPSDDLSRIVLQTEGYHFRFLLIPLRDDAGEEKITEVEPDLRRN